MLVRPEIRLLQKKRELVKFQVGKVSEYSGYSCQFKFRPALSCNGSLTYQCFFGVEEPTAPQGTDTPGGTKLGLYNEEAAGDVFKL